MKNISILMLITGLAVISACASNESTMDTEATMDTDESSAELISEKPVVAMEDPIEEEEVMDTEAPAEVVETPEMTETENAESDAGNLVSTCTYGDQVRVITVVYDNEATGKACEVNYEKSTGVQTLWSAITDKDYCMDKAMAFVEKQEGWGWVCSKLQ